MMKTEAKLAISASSSENAQQALKLLQTLYPCVDETEADIIIALGGDGYMLETLHRNIHRDIPVYGMNRGTVGFLMNDYEEYDLHERLQQARQVVLYPLRMSVIDVHGQEHEAKAINEVSLLRQTHQAAKIRIKIDRKVRMPELICDGLIVCGSAGSTAYNLSAHGPIIPLGSELLAMTPISAFRPRRWRGALLPSSVKVTCQVQEAEKRPVSAVADNYEVRDIRIVEIEECRDNPLRLLFDPEHGLEERILREQFVNA